jgi:periplasmic protein TonB
MIALATRVGIARADALRWSVCCAIVVAAHVAAATVLLLSRSAASSFDAGAPVIMVALPEAPAALPTPPNDLAAAPNEPEVEPTPPPLMDEETRPPEPVASVALPRPKPPRPQPATEERPAPAMRSAAVASSTTVPPAAGAEVEPSAALLRRWESELVAHIERFKRYPAEARARGDHGMARVAFTIDRNGRVLGSRVVQSSGSQQLDEESLALLTRAQPMPRPPSRATIADLSFVVPVRFNIR